MKAILVLGCWGQKEGHITLCNGIKNDILDITSSTEQNISIGQYLDNVYKLCEKPIYKNIHTALWNIQEKFSLVGKPVFNDKFFKQLEDFCIRHNRCGLYLSLELREN